MQQFKCKYNWIQVLVLSYLQVLGSFDNYHSVALQTLISTFSSIFQFIIMLEALRTLGLKKFDQIDNLL